MKGTAITTTSPCCSASSCFMIVAPTFNTRCLVGEEKEAQEGWRYSRCSAGYVFYFYFGLQLQSICFLFFFSLSLTHTHAHTYTHTYIPGFLRGPASHHHVIVSLHQPASQRQPEVPAAQHHHSLFLLLVCGLGRFGEEKKSKNKYYSVSFNSNHKRLDQIHCNLTSIIQFSVIRGGKV